MEKYMIRNIIFYALLPICLFANSLDTIVIEQLQQKQEQKEQSEEKKQSEDSTQPQEERESVNSQDSEHENNTQKEKIQEKGSMQHSIFDFHKNQAQKQAASDTFFSWFVGAGFNGYYQTRFETYNVNFFSSSLHIGGFYGLASHHGFKGYISISYKSLDESNLFAVGGGIDYFYDFKSAGIFGGIYVDIPIQSTKLHSADVILQGGISLYISPKLRIEFMMGYPVAHDMALQRSFSYGVALQYLFTKQ